MHPNRLYVQAESPSDACFLQCRSAPSFLFWLLAPKLQNVTALIDQSSLTISWNDSRDAQGLLLADEGHSLCQAVDAEWVWSRGVGDLLVEEDRHLLRNLYPIWISSRKQLWAVLLDAPDHAAVVEHNHVTKKSLLSFPGVMIDQITLCGANLY